MGNVDDDISSYKSEHLLPDVQAAANMYMAQASEAKAAIKELDNQVYMARYIRNYLTNKSNSSQLLPANSGIDNPASPHRLASTTANCWSATASCRTVARRTR